MLHYWLYSMPESLDYEDEGTVVDVLAVGREWQISFKATYWIARSRQPLKISIGDVVRVVGRSSNTLWIEAMNLPETTL